MADDTPTPAECEQLARSIAMSPSLGERDRLRVMELLRRLARLVNLRR